jgi:hypothetical protein
MYNGDKLIGIAKYYLKPAQTNRNGLKIEFRFNNSVSK